MYYILTPQRNTFQGIVITNGSASYTVFTYECGSIEWSGTRGFGNAAIGFKADDGYYQEHPLSGTDEDDTIDCLNIPTTVWSNVVYKLSIDGKK